MIYPDSAIQKPARKPDLHLLSVLIALVLAGLIGFSFYQFESFRPQNLSNNKNLKIKSSIRRLPIELPFPAESIEISSNKTSLGSQVTLQTKEDLQKVYAFYKNVFAARDWVIKSDYQTDKGYTTQYGKDNDRIVLTLAKDEDLKQVVVLIEHSAL